MIVQPTSGALSDFNRDKLALAIEKTPALKRKVKPQTSRAGDGSTTTSKVYPGGSLTLAIASSAADLRSKTIKVALLDEVDEYPDDSTARATRSA
jgi:phage terminase large subunit GpA-like protein